MVQTHYKNKDSKIITSDLSCYSDQRKSAGYSIKFCDKPGEIYTINNKTFKLQPDEVLIVNDASHVSVQIENPESVKGICLYFDNELISDVSKTAQQSSDNNLNITEVSERTEFIEGLFKKRHLGLERFRNSTFENLIDVDAEELLFPVAKKIIYHQLELKGIRNKFRTSSKSTGDELLRRVLVAREYLETNINNPVSLDELSKHSFLSKFYLLSNFKKAFNLTPHQYHFTLRLNKARMDIQNRDISISEVADNYGFADLASFSKAFKKRFGTSPSKKSKI